MPRGFISRYHETDPGTPTGGTATPPATPPAQPPAQGAATLTQDQFNAALADEKRKWKAQQDDAAAKIRRETEEKAALEKGEFEKLASERGTRLAQIEAEHTTAAERLTAYEAEMERQIKARLKALPDAIRELDPGGDMIARFAWLPKAEALAASMASGTPPRTPSGTPPGPRGGNGGGNGGGDAASLQSIIAEKKARIGGL